ncbi:MAG: hypothetical protein RJB61_1278 [Actinomycetota bacterium]|jgi:ABC-type polysaccharide/polyol phosphate export permease
MVEYGTVDPTQRVAEERAGRVISRVLLVAAVVAAVGLIAPWGDPLALAAIVVVGAIPIARVAWLAWRWARIRDMRYMWAAVMLLVLIAAGPVIALLTS